MILLNRSSCEVRRGGREDQDHNVVCGAGDGVALGVKLAQRDSPNAKDNRELDDQ